METTEKMQHTRGLLYAFKQDRWDEGMLIVREAATGRAMFIGAEDDVPEDCDFDGLAGLLAFDGAKMTRERAIAAGEVEPDDWDDGWDWYMVGAWRHMTAGEAVDLGLVVADPQAPTSGGNDG